MNDSPVFNRFSVVFSLSAEDTLLSSVSFRKNSAAYQEGMSNHERETNGHIFEVLQIKIQLW